MTNARQQERQIKRLRAQIDEIASTFDWDPSESWVQEIKAQLGFFEPVGQLHDNIHRLLYRTYAKFDRRSYFQPSSNTVTARYTERTDPNPLEIFCRNSYELRGYTDLIDKLVIGSHATEVFDIGGYCMARFDGYGRKMHHSSAERARNVQQLLMELLGITLEIEQIAVRDMNHFYEQLVLTRDESGTWQMTIGSKVRA